MRSFQHGHGHHTELRTASFSLIQPILNPLQLPCSALIFVSTGPGNCLTTEEESHYVDWLFLQSLIPLAGAPFLET
ncbi:uncharacterized protein LJ206_017218 isoform 2-T2 [Theristicus caerulescens]